MPENSNNRLFLLFLGLLLGGILGLVLNFIRYFFVFLFLGDGESAPKWYFHSQGNVRTLIFFITLGCLIGSQLVYLLAKKRGRK